MSINKYLLPLLLLPTCHLTHAEEQHKFEANWPSLSQHQAAPDWLADTKFGIYGHWGVYSVPAYGDEWYPHWMYFKDRKEFKYHVDNFGPHSEFEYHDFVPLFKAEKFDPKKWAQLFKDAGAQFAGMVAEHHDGFAMWDSEVTPWNSMDKGPKRDILGELSTEIKSRGMKLITTFHHARNLQRYDSSEHNSWDSHFPYRENLASSSKDPELKYLYGNMPESEWLEKIWFPKLEEVTRKYQPDMIYLDSWLDMIPENYRQRMAADYFNKALEWNKQVAIIRKQDDLPLDMSIDDLEKSRKNELSPVPWLTDDTISIGSWSYTKDLQIKPAADIIPVLIDVVSKNGTLLLNISPMASGEIPANQQQVLMNIGAWLKQNGEAIYGTRTWITFGEGPTTQPEGHFDNHAEFLKVKYSGKDVRYTTKGNAIYVSLLGIPTSSEITLNAFKVADLTIESISLLGSDAKVQWQHSKKGLTLTIPENLPNSIAPVFKIATKS